MNGEDVRGQAAALRRAALCVALLVCTASWGCNGDGPVTPGNGSGDASPGTPSAVAPTVKGAYTFWLEADPDGRCGWPITRFFWPVSVEVSSYAQGATVGSIVFPPAPAAPSRWALHAGPAGTQLVPPTASPGPAAAAYDLVVDGGRWEASGPTRAPDGRGELKSGTASGARLTLVLPGSDKRWECRADARWSLLTRWTDRD